MSGSDRIIFTGPPGPKGNDGVAGTNIFAAPAEDYGAEGDGTTDDTQAFTDALAANNVVGCLPGKTYLVRDLSLSSNRQLLGNGATLKAAPAARWLVRLSGLRSSARDLVMNDGGGRLIRTTTLASPVIAGATVVTVIDSSALVVGMTMLIETDTNHERHDAIITAINGPAVTLKRPLNYNTSAGRRIWAAFPALWIGDTLRFDIYNISMQACPFAMATLPQTPDGDGADNGTVRSVDVGGAYLIGFAHYANSANIVFDDIYLNGNQSLVNTYAGDGVTTDFVFPEYLKQLRAAKVRIDNVLKELTTDYTILNETTVRLNTPPALGAAVAITNVFPGWMGHLVDCAGKTQASGGIKYNLVRALGYHVGKEVRDCDLQYFFNCLSDSADTDALRLRGTITNVLFVGESLTFAYDNCLSMNFAGSAVEFAGSVRMRLMPADQKLNGVLGNKINPVAGTIELDPLSWWGTGPWTNIAAGAGKVLTSLATFLPFATSMGEQFRIVDTVAPAVNKVTVQGSTSGNPVKIGVDGDDTDGSLQVGAKGAGILDLHGKTIFGAMQTTLPALTNGDGALVATDASHLKFYYKLANVTKHVDWTLGAGLYNDTATATQLADQTSTINTTDKATGKQVWDTTNNRIMIANGATATSRWYTADGSAFVTPA